jgi:hypothetical protein
MAWVWGLMAFLSVLTASDIGKDRLPQMERSGTGVERKAEAESAEPEKTREPTTGEQIEAPDPDLIVSCEGFEVRKVLEEEARKTRWVMSGDKGLELTLWEAEWKAEEYFDEQMRRMYNRREDHFRAFCANVVGPKKSLSELVIAYADDREENCCWTLDVYAVGAGGGRLSQTALKNTRPPMVEDLNRDGVAEILAGDYRAYFIRELPRRYAPHLQVALCGQTSGSVTDCSAKFPVVARRDIARLKKELAEASEKQVNAIPRRRGLAIGIVAAYARLHNARQGLADIAKLCPERECKDWVQTKTPEVLKLLSGPVEY